MLQTSDLVRKQTDVLVIGAGLAGLSAAVRLRELDPKADVTLLTKVHPVRSHSGAAQGGINAAIRGDDRWEDHKFDTIKGSGFLADQDAVRVLTSEAPEAIYRLDRYGSLFSRNEDGTIAQRPFGGQRTNRTCYVSDKTGHFLLHTLWEQAVRHQIPLEYDVFAMALVRDDDRVTGVFAYDLLNGMFILYSAKAVVIARRRAEVRGSRGARLGRAGDQGGQPTHAGKRSDHRRRGSKQPRRDYRPGLPGVVHGVGGDQCRPAAHPLAQRVALAATARRSFPLCISPCGHARRTGSGGWADTARARLRV